MKLSRKRDIERHEPLAEAPTTETPSVPGQWSTAFLMAGSALLGATAVAFWNRRTIAYMRVQILAEAAKPRPHLNTDEEIF
ncbi:MAG: hypothetical protein V4587_15045 [Acidobacteriota bacterium]